MKRRLVLLVFLTTVWLMGGCGDQPSPTPTETPTIIQPTDTPEPTKASPTPTPTRSRPDWLPVPPENLTFIQITDNLWMDSSPMWSPDGSQILFSSNRECYKENEAYGLAAIATCINKFDLYLMAPDGSNQTQLTDVQSQGKFILNHEAWLPDGEKITLTSFDGSGDFYERAYTFSVDQAKQSPIGMYDMEVLVDIGPWYWILNFAWSSDGKMYAYDYSKYRVYPTEQQDIVVIDEESGKELYRKTTTGDTLCEFKRWLPNSESIVIWCERDLNEVHEAHIYSVDVNGVNKGLLNEIATFAVLGTWSPDGKWVISPSSEEVEGGEWELLHIESGETIYFSFGGYFTVPCSWSPDGKWLAFTEPEYGVGPDLSDSMNIYLVDMSWLEMEWD